MEKDQNKCRQAEIPEDEILHYLVEKYHPSNIELRRVRHPLSEFIESAENEKMLLSEIQWREEKRQFNRSQRLNQEIAAVTMPWPTVHGEEATVSLLYLVRGKETEDALARAKAITEGYKEKEERLIDRQIHGRHFKEMAKKLQVSVERRITRGGSGTGTGAAP
jgi:hypothetical protein